MRKLLWILTGFATAAYLCNSVADPDLWWHITVGRWIIANGQVPHFDYWNQFGIGQPWRAYSWSVEIIFALTDRYFGDYGLASLHFVFCSILTLSLMHVMSRMSRDATFGALAGVFAAVACFNHLTLRPQTLVWILFALLIAETGDSKQRFSNAALLRCVLIGSLWANIHLTAVLGLLAIIGWSLSPRGVKETSKVAGSFFLGTLITPYLGGEWITFIKKSGHPLKFQSIAEFKPATILQYSSVFVLLVLVMLVAVAFVNSKRFKSSQTAVGGIFILAGLTAVKFLPFAAIYLTAMLSAWWKEANLELGDKVSSEESRRGHLGNLGEGLFRAIKYVKSMPNEIVSGLSFLFLCIAIVHVNRLIQHPVDDRVNPRTAVDFILSKGLEHPIMNEFGAGGYLMYRLSDQNGVISHPVIIDGRTNVNPPEIWTDYMEAFTGKPLWWKFVDKIKPNTIMWRRGSPFVSILLATGDWCQIFVSGEMDEDQAVLVKRAFKEAHANSFPGAVCGPRQL